MPDWPIPRSRRGLPDLGTTPFMGAPSDFGRFIAAETAKWAKAVKFAGLKPE